MTAKNREALIARIKEQYGEDISSLVYLRVNGVIDKETFEGNLAEAFKCDWNDVNIVCDLVDDYMKSDGTTDNIYTRNGWKDREDYLKNLSYDYGVPPMVVFELAGLLGEDEDFDGLVTSLEDFPIAQYLAENEVAA